MIWAVDENPPFFKQTKELERVWQDLINSGCQSEEESVRLLLQTPIYSREQSKHIQEQAKSLIDEIRSKKLKQLSIENFLKTHNLNSQEGLALLCLAEALLRIPDSRTKTLLIRDKIAAGKWDNKDDDLLLQKFANIGLYSTGRFLSIGHNKSSVSVVTSLIRRFGEPLIRQIMAQAVKIIAQQFVMGETIKNALNQANDIKNATHRFSFDMLGEGARTKADADRYFENYKVACLEIGEHAEMRLKAVDSETIKGDASNTNAKKNESKTILDLPSLSIKLSALHPRFERAQRKRVLDELVPRVLELAQIAKKYKIGLTIDAEESQRLPLMLEVFYAVYTDESLHDFDGFGLAVQSYQKRALSTVRFIIETARHFKKRIPLRLVKGAYWDSEIKFAQVHGLPDYPVFTEKHHSDVAYLVAANEMLKATDALFPQFATHNAHTVAAIIELAKSHHVTDLEFQRLHGMGEGLYEIIFKGSDDESGPRKAYPCRIYAPIGNYRDLLAYLVRRMLENGANTSFVKQVHDTHVPLEWITADPFQITFDGGGKPHPKIVLPQDLFLDRKNSIGIDLSSEVDLEALNTAINPDGNIAQRQLADDNTLSQKVSSKEKTLQEAHFQEAARQETTLHRLIDTCSSHYKLWEKTSVDERAHMLIRLSEIFQKNRDHLLNALVFEGKKTIPDAISEVREAIDFCQYYATLALTFQKNSHFLPGPTGEINLLSYHSRGVFVCISPWNFPLAIFIGQIAAALVTGNCVIAKPASRTPIIAKMVIEMAYLAGIPKGVLMLTEASGKDVTDFVLTHAKIAGVAFTGSTETAYTINQQLAKRRGPIVPFIAETGGINAMIVDSSALPEQVVDDVIASAYLSAGQRCSSLRLLIVQNEVADRMIDMLIGAIKELKVGPSHLLSTDIGPVINRRAMEGITAYCQGLKADFNRALCLYEHPIDPSLLSGTNHFVGPHLFQVSSVADVNVEIFGPILHIVRYRGEYLDQVINDINALGYGLTLGLHTRLESTMEIVASRARVGNLYVNRNMIGATVGVQPFGGEGMSGTGFKAGGPNYLLKFMTERVYTQNTTASGGNAKLVSTL